MQDPASKWIVGLHIVIPEACLRKTSNVPDGPDADSKEERKKDTSDVDQWLPRAAGEHGAAHVMIAYGRRSNLPPEPRVPDDLAGVGFEGSVIGKLNNENFVLIAWRVIHELPPQDREFLSRLPRATGPGLDSLERRAVAIQKSTETGAITIWEHAID